MASRPQKITFGEVREMGVRGLLVPLLGLSLPQLAQGAKNDAGI
jgi:hypothetical protein